MKDFEVALWIALPSIIVLALLALVYVGIRLRRRFPPLRRK